MSSFEDQLDDMTSGILEPKKKRDPRGSWRNRIALLREERGNRCEECGWSGSKKMPLEFAHVKPTKLNGRGRGQTQRFMDIVRNPDAYELLCGPCHRKQEKELKSV